MVSIALKSPGSSGMSTVTAGFTQIANYVDVVGISVYPYAFFTPPDGNPDDLPSNWLSQIKTIAPGKSYAVTETGWIATNLSIPSYSLNVTGTDAYQNSFVTKLFNESNAISAETVIWFTSYDYDTLWTNTLGYDPLSQIWKNTGLVNDSLVKRTGCYTWESWLSRSRQ